MDEMIERVANAIHARAYETRGTQPNPLGPDWVECARAAIEAMRDPTLEMLDAGNRAATQARVSGISGMTIEAQTKAKCARENSAWRAMIEAALAK